MGLRKILTRDDDVDTVAPPLRKKGQMPQGSAAFVIHTDWWTGRQSGDVRDILNSDNATKSLDALETVLERQDQEQPKKSLAVRGRHDDKE